MVHPWSEASGEVRYASVRECARVLGVSTATVYRAVALGQIPHVRVSNSIRTRELVTFLKTEANARGLDLTAHVNRMLDGVRTWFGLPHAAAALIEADREALGLDRYEYLLHVVFQRSLELREQGPGFDAPKVGPKKR